MNFYRRQGLVKIETEILLGGKWRLVSAAGVFTKDGEPKLRFVMLLATGEEISAKLTDEQRAAIIKALLVASKRGGGGPRLR